MSLMDDVVELVALADVFVKDEGFYANVVWKAWTGQDEDGTPSAPVVQVVPALVIRKTGVVKDASGQVITYHTYIGIFRPLTPISNSKRSSHPVDMMDTFILPDGTTGPIVATDGYVNGQSGLPVYTQVYLG